MKIRAYISIVGKSVDPATKGETVEVLEGQVGDLEETEALLQAIEDGECERAKKDAEVTALPFNGGKTRRRTSQPNAKKTAKQAEQNSGASRVSQRKQRAVA